MDNIKNFLWKNKIAISACILTLAFGIGYWVISSPGPDTTIGEDISVGNNLYVTGNVGIGTTGPQGPLHVFKDGAAADTIGGSLILNRYLTGGSWRGGAIFSYYPTAAAQDVLAFAVSQDTTPLDTAKVKMVIGSNGNVGIGTASPQRKLQVGAVGGAGNANFNILGRMSISAVDDIDNKHTYLWEDGTIHGLNAYDYGSNSALPISIGWSGQNVYIAKSGGNVGIGTVSPAYKLDVEGYVQAYGYYTGDIIFQKDGTDVWRMYEDEEGLYTQSLKTGQDVLAIKNSGNVGIGTTSPNQKLMVAGNANVTGNLTAGSIVPSFESGEISIAAGSVSVAHGLGSVPKLWMIVARNKTAEQGYNPGDEVIYDPSAPGQDFGPLSGAWVDSTSIGISSPNGGIKLSNKTTGTHVDGTPSRWKLIFRAWK